MTIFIPRPANVTQSVGQWLESHRSAAKQYANVTFAIDSSGVYDLHELASQIYQDGFSDGHHAGLDVSRSMNRAKEDQ